METVSSISEPLARTKSYLNRIAQFRLDLNKSRVDGFSVWLAHYQDIDVAHGPRTIDSFVARGPRTEDESSLYATNCAQHTTQARRHPKRHDQKLAQWFHELTHSIDPN
ncbi:MAG: hypothetical protein ACRDVC_03020 [Acidimicrobiales bacterium]